MGQSECRKKIIFEWTNQIAAKLFRVTRVRILITDMLSTNKNAVFCRPFEF